jgi:hypothetical protein
MLDLLSCRSEIKLTASTLWEIVSALAPLFGPNAQPFALRKDLQRAIPKGDLWC